MSVVDESELVGEAVFADQFDVETTHFVVTKATTEIYELLYDFQH